MWFHYTITVPAGTLDTAPVRSELDLDYGVVTYIGVGYPAGCNQLVKVRLYHQEHQVFPANSGEASAWNGGIEGGDEHYRLTEAPLSFIARCSAPLTTKNHVIGIFINLLPIEVAEPWSVQTSALDKLKNLFGLGTG